VKQEKNLPFKREATTQWSNRVT